MRAKTNRSRIVSIYERPFVWFVKETGEHSKVLQVVSEDKRFIVHYTLGQDESRRHLTVLGSQFSRAEPNGADKRRFRCPAWEEESGVVTSEGIRNLICWSLFIREPVLEVNAAGMGIPHGGLCSLCGYDLRDGMEDDTDLCPRCRHLIAERHDETDSSHHAEFAELPLTL